jgi:hypothetical protein
MATAAGSTASIPKYCENLRADVLVCAPVTNLVEYTNSQDGPAVSESENANC